jgi:hypothetical protein
MEYGSTTRTSMGIPSSPFSRGTFQVNDNNHNRTPPSDDELVNQIVREMEEAALFRDLSDLDLIRAARDSETLADDPCVFELLTRLNPAWQTDLSLEPPNAPSYIHISVPIYVARDTLAYDRCHCVEDGHLDDRMKPCVYCALKHSLSINVKNDE